MQKALGPLLAIFFLFCSTQAMASSYEEVTLARCGYFNLVRVTTGSQEMGGKIVTTTAEVVRFSNNVELPTEKEVREDLDQWKVVTGTHSHLMISRSFQYPGEMIYSFVAFELGRQVTAGACNGKTAIVLY